MASDEPRVEDVTKDSEDDEGPPGECCHCRCRRRRVGTTPKQRPNSPQTASRGTVPPYAPPARAAAASVPAGRVPRGSVVHTVWGGGDRAGVQPVRRGGVSLCARLLAVCVWVCGVYGCPPPRHCAVCSCSLLPTARFLHTILPLLIVCILHFHHIVAGCWFAPQHTAAPLPLHTSDGFSPSSRRAHVCVCLLMWRCRARGRR